MWTTVLPLRLALIQTLLLLIAIAVESVLLSWELQFPPRKSVQYAASINLLNVVAGWLFFFAVEQFIAPNIRQQIVRFVFFDQWDTSTNFFIAAAGLLAFVSSYFLKIKGLELLQVFLGEQPKEEPIPIRMLSEKEKATRSPRVYNSSRQVLRRNIEQQNAVLIANAGSFTAISLVLLIRFLLHDIS